MADQHANFAYGTVLTPPSPATTGTSLGLLAGEGAYMPTPPFNATVWPRLIQPTPVNAEIVRVTAINGDTLTISRQQETSSAREIVATDQFSATITTKTLTDVETAIAASLQAANSLSDVADAGTSRLNLHVAEMAVCQVAATSNITPSGLQTIDGYTTLTGDLVLCTGQTTASQNGPWVAGSGAWVRPHEYASAAAIVAGRTVTVVNGTVNALSRWVLTTAGSVTVDTTATAWQAQESGGGSYFVSSTDSNGFPVLSLAASTWGIDGTGPYYQASGALTGEAAVLSVDSATGTPMLTLIAGQQ